MSVLASARSFDVLQTNHWVRHEWRTEPTSWLVTIHSDPEMMKTIVNEVEEGLWN